MLGSRWGRTANLRNKGIRAVSWMIVLLSVGLFCLVSQRTYAYDTPEGYDDHDYQKMVAFLELPNGTRNNGRQLSAYYNPQDPTTWGGIEWDSGIDRRILTIDWNYKSLVGNIDVSGCSVLEKLTFVNNDQLTELDVSGCSALKELTCNNSQLAAIDVSGCTSLRELICYSNGLTALDVSECVALESLRCDYNQLTILDMTGCSALTKLICGSNPLTSLDVMSCPALTELYCSSTLLTALDVNGCTDLSLISCSANRLTELDVSRCSALKTLSCSKNQLTVLDLSGSLALELLRCIENGMTNLDVSGCFALKELYCSDNQLAALDVSECVALESLWCDYNQLTDLDLGGCPALSSLVCYYNQLTRLDLSGCTALTGLTCYSNSLTSLDISDCTALENLECGVNRLPELDVSNCKNLTRIGCGWNKLVKLDVSSCSALKWLFCTYNQLTFATLPVSLPVPGGTYEYSPQRRVPIGVPVGFLSNVVVGAEIDLSAEADVSGEDTIFTWYKDDGTEIEPTTIVNGVFTFDHGFGEHTIYCRMTNIALPELVLETEMILLIGPAKPEITSHPQSVTVDSGATAYFSVTAEAADAGAGGVLSFQWQTSTDGGNKWYNVYGATTNNYTELEATFADNGCQYRCAVTNTKDRITSSVFSNPAILAVVAKPLIVRQPRNITVLEGATATFSVTAEAADTGIGGVLNYQWQISTNGGSVWEDIEGASINSYATPAVAYVNIAYKYRCQVTNTRNKVIASSFSNPATLTVVASPAIIIQPQNTTVAEGAAATFSVAAEAADTGAGGALGYQWQLSTDGGNVWEDIEGASINSYTIPAVNFVNNDYEYRCQVVNTRNGVAATVYSNPAILSIVTIPAITSQPQNITVAIGANVTFTIAVEVVEADESGGLSYQWQLSTNGGGGWNIIEGASTNSYTIPAVTFVNNDYQYRCQVTNTRNGVASSAFSNPATLSVVANPTITSQPQDSTVLEGATATFSVTVEAADSGIGGVLSYQWQVLADGGSSWSNIDGATINSYTTPAVALDNDGYQYRCQATNTKNGVSDSTYSNPATLCVVASPTITSQPQDTTVLEGATATFSVTAEAADSGAGGVLSYQWQVSADGGGSWTDIAGAVTNSYTIVPVTYAYNWYQYRCKVTNTRNEVLVDVFSAAATLTVKTHSIIFIKPTADNDESNPVNISSGSLVLVQIIGEVGDVAAIIIRIDGGAEQAIITSGSAFYYLMPADLSEGWHTITIKLTNTAGCEIEATVTFYWDSYRQGFGFGRFDFGEADDH